MTFTPITKDTLSLLDRHLGENSKGMADLTVGYQYMWSDTYATAFGTVAGIPFLSAEGKDGRVYAPVRVLSTDELSLAAEALLEHEGDARLVCLTEGEAEALRILYPHAAVRESDGDSDYLYDRASLAAMTGKAYQKKRNHAAAFLRTHGEGTLIPITEENRDAALSFLSLFEENDDDTTPSALAEPAAARRLVTALPLPACRGYLLLAGDGEVHGLSVTEERGETLYIHVEKALRAVRGAYPVLARETAKTSGVSLLNREEDDGNEGLRRSKLSYLPTALLSKYTVTIPGKD